jgi:hypothetical protein
MQSFVVLESYLNYQHMALCVNQLMKVGRENR